MSRFWFWEVRTPTHMSLYFTRHIDKGFCHRFEMKSTVENSCRRFPPTFGNTAVIARVPLSKPSGTSMPDSSSWDTASIMSCHWSGANNGFLSAEHHFKASGDEPQHSRVLQSPSTFQKVFCIPATLIFSPPLHSQHAPSSLHRPLVLLAAIILSDPF